MSDGRNNKSTTFLIYIYIYILQKKKGKKNKPKSMKGINKAKIINQLRGVRAVRLRTPQAGAGPWACGLHIKEHQSLVALFMGIWKSKEWYRPYCPHPFPFKFFPYVNSTFSFVDLFLILFCWFLFSSLFLSFNSTFTIHILT